MSLSNVSDGSRCKVILPPPMELGEMILSHLDHESIATLHATVSAGLTISWLRQSFFSKPCKIWQYDHHEFSLHDPKYYRLVRKGSTTRQYLEECKYSDMGSFTLNPLLTSSDDCPGMKRLREYPRTLWEIQRDQPCEGSRDAVARQVFPNLTLFSTLSWDAREHAFCFAESKRRTRPSVPLRRLYLLSLTPDDSDEKPSSTEGRDFNQLGGDITFAGGGRFNRTRQQEDQAIPQRDILAVILQLTAFDLQEGYHALSDEHAPPNAFLNDPADHFGIDFVDGGRSGNVYTQSDALQELVKDLLVSRRNSGGQMTVAGLNLLSRKLATVGKTIDFDHVKSIATKTCDRSGRPARLRILEDGQSLVDADPVFDLSNYALPH